MWCGTSVNQKAPRFNELPGEPGIQTFFVARDLLDYVDRRDFYIAHHSLFSYEIENVAFRQELLRKEVIQPQVPLRLPCYDFTPVADLTVVGCLQRLAHRLRVKPTPMV